MNFAVIGSGVGGLAIAIRLANKGHRVTMYEKNPVPGGKLSELREGGYRFDTGPSLFTMPGLIDELFEISGKEIAKYLSYQKLEINCKYFYPDGTRLNIYQDRIRLDEEIRAKTHEDPENLEKHLRKAREAYQIGANVFIFNSMHKLSNYLSDAYRHVLFKLHKLDFLRTMHRANARQFRDPKLVQLFDRYATYNGSDPFRAPATLNMIAHLENNIGAYFPDEGMYSIVTALYKLARELGVRFFFNTPVDEIILAHKKVKALRIGKEVVSYDYIVSDVDIRHLFRNMINPPLRTRSQRLEPSSSALIFYWGIKKEFPELELHNILFSDRYREEFRMLFKERKIIDDPTIYIFISARRVKTDAPESCENWFVMINVPSDSGQNWPDLITTARKSVVSKINKVLRTDIESCIEFEKIASPGSIEENTFSMDGAIYGNASNSVFSAFLRHPNFSSRIKNMYFVGGSVHPGGGIPLCLAGAKIVDQEIPLNT